MKLSPFFAAALLGAAAVLADEPDSAARKPLQAEAAFNGYRDDNRLSVASGAMGLTLPLGPAWFMRMKFGSDRIAIDPPQAGTVLDPHAGHGAHDHIDEDDNPSVDAVSGASARVGYGGAGTVEYRMEGSAGISRRVRSGSAPVTVTCEVRASHEPDYLSAGGTVSAEAEFFQGNTVATVFIGGGRDEIDPPVVPAGQQGRWPAVQAKLSGGFSLAQSLTPRLTVSGGASAAWLAGRLSSPYRNSLVGITAFPERLPDRRLRATAFAQASYYLGWGSALHLREGLYADDWDVSAWIPEAALAKEFGPVLLTVRHRFYAQTQASFYLAVYRDRTGFQTGDARLGRLYGQTVGVEAEVPLSFKTRRSGPMVSVEYVFSGLEYPDLYPRTLYGHVVTLRVTGEF